MTGDQRQQLKHAIDQQVRARIAALIQGGFLTACAGCGTELELRTDGCRTCNDRHRNWERRSDPAFLERQRAYDRARGPRKRARARQRAAA